MSVDIAILSVDYVRNLDFVPNFTLFLLFPIRSEDLSTDLMFDHTSPYIPIITT